MGFDHPIDDPDGIPPKGAAHPMHPLAAEGIHLFNQGSFFEAHEALETAWMEESGPIRDLYRGILQGAVAYYHAGRGNPRGACKMFARSRRWLEPFLPTAFGIEVARLLTDSGQVDQEVKKRGIEITTPVDPSRFPPVRFRP